MFAMEDMTVSEHWWLGIFDKHRQPRTEAEKEEEQIDNVAASLFSLLYVFHKNMPLPPKACLFLRVWQPEWEG